MQILGSAWVTCPETLDRTRELIWVEGNRERSEAEAFKGKFTFPSVSSSEGALLGELQANLSLSSPSRWWSGALPGRRVTKSQTLVLKTEC